MSRENGRPGLPGPPRRLPSFGIVTCLILLWASAVAAARKPPNPEELFNPLLGVQWSHWLVGPVSWIANDEEIEDYLLFEPTGTWAADTRTLLAQLPTEASGDGR